jgi:hypothetical protein
MTYSNYPASSETYQDLAIKPHKLEELAPQRYAELSKYEQALLRKLYDEYAQSEWFDKRMVFKLIANEGSLSSSEASVLRALSSFTKAEFIKIALHGEGRRPNRYTFAISEEVRSLNGHRESISLATPPLSVSDKEFLPKKPLSAPAPESRVSYEAILKTLTDEEFKYQSALVEVQKAKSHIQNLINLSQ